MDNRPSWDEIWMNLARTISKRSTCKVPNRHIGCVIVTSNNENFWIGYNGGAKGDDNICEYRSDDIIEGTSRCTCAHAEMNAIAKLDRNHPGEKIMYVTMSPCGVCANLIKNVDICTVVYEKVYDKKIIDKLNSLGVDCVEYSEYRRRFI